MLTDYDILHISETQDIHEVRKAYRKIVKKIHPDVSSESDLIKNHLLFIQINKLGCGYFNGYGTILKMIGSK